MKNRIRRWAGISALLVLSTLVAVWIVPSQATAKAKQGQIILHVQTMVGNEPDQTINGVESDELPWDIKSVEGVLFSSGDLLMSIRGLVFADDPSVPPELVGTNDDPFFTAIVSCLTEDANGDLVVENIQTDEFPASPKGNCIIHDHVNLPHPCIAPIVFVTGDEGAWFAVTGAP